MTAISSLGWGVIVFSILIVLCSVAMWRSNRKMKKLEEHSIEYALHRHFNYWMFWVLIFNIFMLMLMLKGIYIDPVEHKFLRF